MSDPSKRGILVGIPHRRYVSYPTTYVDMVNAARHPATPKAVAVTVCILMEFFPGWNILPVLIPTQGQEVQQSDATEATTKCCKTLEDMEPPPSSQCVKRSPTPLAELLLTPPSTPPKSPPSLTEEGKQQHESRDMGRDKREKEGDGKNTRGIKRRKLHQDDSRKAGEEDDQPGFFRNGNGNLELPLW
ncbi:uncharacterized protein K452DRAFT_312747 [Aplosporella prunicola CBS 121167]|uniref:Uncharacterized protein n=1 Tax=Aplosporella prunicola CBS 121167 TaxID=1176127 RepID=A0A6A6AZ70_9PEZI|nr:uncharacterized protein K452DRAFT_312747 [Aplosporella prunicola CBS 121167]KAF2136936.1 hypothetical protein K452DRAFT_312747 [Aplosporella prunicola CBS 121167]